MSVLASQTDRTGAPAPDAGRPAHIAIIMDGNGRWAMARGLPRGEGHRRGVEAVRNIVKVAVELRLPYLTLFSFSSENWTRPPEEVDFLFGLFRRYIRRDVAELHAAGIRIHVIGRRDGLPSDILGMIEDAERLTAENTGLQLVLAFNYGARDEIARAARKIAEAVREGSLDPASVDETTVGRFLDTATLPDPDLIIRTSGELRLSNFLLWQSAYAELVFVPVYWPDFNQATLSGALDEYAGRTRRYGGTGGRSAR
jgi:undecaprenyl diphosphate synthase